MTQPSPNISTIAQSPFVTKDGHITRQAYYFLLGLINAIAPASGNISLADVQILEVIDAPGGGLQLPIKPSWARQFAVMGA